MKLTPVDFNPFEAESSAQPKLTQVDRDPSEGSGAKLTPVDYDPFAGDATWGDTLKAIPDQIAGGAQQAVGGLAQAAATESKPDPVERFIPGPLRIAGQAQRLIKKGAQALAGDENVQAVKEFGQEQYQKGTERIEEATPENQSFWQQAVSTAGVSAGTMLPTGIAAFMLKQPGLMAGTFGVQEFGRAFGDAKAQGLDDIQATRHATASGLLEAGTEYLPAKTLFKAGTGPFKRLVNFMARELPGENIAELGQMLSERINGLDDEITAEQVVDTIKMTSAATLITGGSQSIAASGLDYLARHRKKTPEERDAEAIKNITSAPDVDSAIDAATQSLDTASADELQDETDLEQQLATLETPESPPIQAADTIYKSEQAQIQPVVPAKITPTAAPIPAQSTTIPEDRRQLTDKRARVDAIKQRLTGIQEAVARGENRSGELLEVAGLLRNELQTDDLTSLPNFMAFEEDIAKNPNDHVLFGDLDDFKKVNDEMGHDGADLVIKKVAELKRESAQAAGIRPYRRSGDEFLGAGIDPQTLDKYGQEVQKRLANATIKVQLPDGSVKEYTGFGFSYGIGKTKQEAEDNANRQKTARRDAGLRQGTRDAERLPAQPATGQPDNRRADTQTAESGEQRESRVDDGQPATTERSGRPLAGASAADAGDGSISGQSSQERGQQNARDTGKNIPASSTAGQVNARQDQNSSSADLRSDTAREAGRVAGKGDQQGRTGTDSQPATGQRKTGEQVNEQRGSKPNSSDTGSEQRNIPASKTSGGQSPVAPVRSAERDTRRAVGAGDNGANASGAQAPRSKDNRLAEEDLLADLESGTEAPDQGASSFAQPQKEQTNDQEKTGQAAEVSEVKTDQKPAGKIEDFGEKLEGAKKDRVITLSDDLKDDDIANQPFSKLWPADEYEQYEDPFTAAVAFAAREEVPAKPRKSYKLRRWIETVKTVRGLAQSIASGETSRDDLLKKMDGVHALKQFANKIRVLEAIPRDQWKRIDKVELYPEAISYVGDKKEPSPFSTFGVDGKYTSLQTADIDRVIEAVKEKLGNQEATETRMVFEVRGRPGNYFINKKGDREYRHLKEFNDDSANKALAYVRDNYDDLVKAWEGVKDRDNVKEKDLRRDVNRPRAGSNWRKGKDITPEKFQETFGFRGGQFGNWVSQGAGAKERQGLLNQAYDAFMDLATILGIPPKSISLNGTLGISFGARGKGWASAHFEPGNLVINLTKPRGAGALGHEWFHALDNYFARMRNEGNEVRPTGNRDFQQAYREANFITYRPEPVMVHVQTGKRMTKPALEAERARNPELNFFAPENWERSSSHPEGVRPEVETRWAEVVKALNASPMAARARKIDKSADGYWSQIIERGARSFENYLISKMTQEGYHNDYLANVVGPGDFQRDPGRYPYLMPDEVAPIAEAFDNLFGELKTKETDKGVALYSKHSATDKRTLGLPVASVQKVIDEFRDSLNGVPEIEYTVVKTQDEAFGEQSREAGRIKGAYHNGRIVLVAENLNGRSDALRVLRHETLAHFGLNTLPAETKAEIIQKIIDARESLKKHWTAADQNYPEASEQVKAEEVFARIAEDKPSQLSRVWNEIVRIIQAALKKMGLVDDTVTMAELRSMVESIAEGIRRGDQAAGMEEQPAFSKSGVDLRGTDATLDRIRPRNAMMFKTPYTGRSGAQLVGYEWKWRTEDIVDSRGEDKTVRVSDWEQSITNPVTNREIVHQFYIKNTDGKTELVSAETAAKMLGVSVSTARNSAKRLLQNEIEQAKKEERAKVEIEKLLESDWYDSPAEAIENATGFLRDVWIKKRNWGKDSYAQYAGNETIPMAINSEGQWKIGSAIGVPAEMLKDAGITDKQVKLSEIWDREGNPVPARGTFDPSDPNILFSKTVQPAFKDWKLPDTMAGTFSSLMTKKEKLMTKARQARRKMQDKFIVWKDVQDQIQKRGGTLSDFSDAYNKFTLIEGKIGDKFKKLFDDHIQPIVQDLTMSGVTIDQLGEYLYAQFAPQRNKRIAEINPDLPDGGSGLTNKEAADILAKFTPAETKQLERLAQKVYAMQRFKLDTLVDAGRLTAEVRDELLKDDRYVPLKGFADTADLVVDSAGIGRGFDQAKDVFKRAKGRKTLAAEMLSTSVRDVENAIIAAEKNRVGQAVLKMVMDNPNENLWKVNPIKIEKAFNKASGQVEQRVITDYKALARDPNVFVTWVKGKPYAIEFRDNPMGESSLARAVKNMGVDNVPTWATYLAKLNRWLSYANTALSPEFLLTNPIRDIQTALTKAFGDYDARIAGQILKNLPKAIRGAVGGIGEGKVAKKIAGLSPTWVDYFKEYAAEGGKTDYFRSKTVNEMRDDLEAELKAAAKGTKGAAIRAFRHLYRTVENGNAVLENMTRLSTYITLREAGYSKHKAATAAKNISVNFNRKGEAGAFVNSLYLFYNASMQGTHLTLRLLRNPKVQKLLVAAGAGMAVLTQFNILAGGDDEDGEANYFKIPEYERERNIIIMWPDGSGRYTKFPMPYGLNVPMNAAAAITHVANGQGPLKEALWLGGSAWNSFSPVGENGWNIVAPTVLDPFVDIALNRNYADRAIMPEENPFEKVPTPDSQKAFGSTHPGYKAVAEKLNELFGGNEQKPGFVDISPETIQHLVETYTGAAGGFLNRVVTWATDPEMETSRKPFIRKFYGEPTPYSVSQSYRDNKANILYYKERLDFLKERAKEDPRNMSAVVKFKTENAEGLALVRDLEGGGSGDYRIKGTEDKLRDLYKDRKKYEAQGNKDKVKETNEKIEAEQRKFNSKYNAVFLDRGIVEELGLLKLKD